MTPAPSDGAEESSISDSSSDEESSAAAHGKACTGELFEVRPAPVLKKLRVIKWKLSGCTVAVTPLMVRAPPNYGKCIEGSDDDYDPMA